MQSHEYYMQLALELSQKGREKVSPNPMVGCIIVKDDKIIGQGYHKEHGAPHAEPNAVNSVTNKTDIEGADVYVTLEPCSHWGKTPPCANLLSELSPKRVIIAVLDSNPLVAGRGIKILESRGIEVITGVLEKEARALNKRFFTAIEKQRPYVILKWAQTKNGYIGGDNHHPIKITNHKSDKIVHKLRAYEDAILVGTNTALFDNPSLTTRLVIGKNPLRLFIDKQLNIPKGHALINQETRTICYNAIKNDKKTNLEYIKLTSSSFVSDILTDLHKRKINSLIVEGGAKLLASFIEENMWDEAMVFEGNLTVSNGTKAPVFNQKPATTQTIDTDKLHLYFNKN